ncbi:MAG: replication factor C large subunit [Candidatus Micrarchaeota archaeon]|nr:replication factor C large subunit [Candidatus Micrarchaeota archaeon]
MPLSEKYAPKALEEIVGNGSAIERLRTFGADAQKKVQGKPLLLYGPSGSGKTAAAHAFAYSNGFDVIEMNASDYRDAKTLESTLLPASKSSGLFARKLLIILDEIDERSDKFDAGSERIITQLIKESKHPILLIANDYWDRKIAFMRDNVDKVEFKRVSKAEIVSLLKSIAGAEDLKVDDSIIDELANRCSGDIRGAINDLELMSQGTPELMENIGMRDRKMEVFGVLDRIFMSRSFDTARLAQMNTDLDSDMLLNWIEENIPNRYSWKSDIANAYSNIAKASFFLSHASRDSYYSYMRYSSILMSSGVSLSANGETAFFRSYAFPSTIRQLSKSKSGRVAINSVITKLIYILHAHKKDVFNGYLQLMKAMIKEGQKEEGEEETLAFFHKNYGLEEKDLDAILASN